VRQAQQDLRVTLEQLGQLVLQDHPVREVSQVLKDLVVQLEVLVQRVLLALLAPREHQEVQVQRGPVVHQDLRDLQDLRVRRVWLGHLVFRVRLVQAVLMDNLVPPVLVEL